MKFINLLAFLCAALLFAGCASTDDNAKTAADPMMDKQHEAHESHDGSGGLLMDQYKSGEIPGYRDDHKPDA